MSTSVTSLSTSAETQFMQGRALHPSFFGTVRGELFKMRKQWTTWIMLILLAGIIALPYIVEGYVPRLKNELQTVPLHFLNNLVQTDLSVLRIFIGIFLLILTARVFGQEYQLGTIRILLARGVGRLQLLCAKLLAVVIVALLVLIAALLFNAILTCILTLILTGDLNAFNSLTSTFWSDTGVYLLTVMISMGVTILLAMAVSVVGRSLSFGLSASLAWFPIDNFGVFFLVIAFRVTNNTFWENVSAYLLGPNLNQMSVALARDPANTTSIGIPPLATVTGTHTLLVTLAYAVVFVVVALVLTWKRDVKE
jgi:ABC-2 type transport system permease protein